MSSVSLHVGPNPLQARGFINPTSQEGVDKAGELVGSYLSGNDKVMLALPNLSHPKTKLKFQVNWLRSILETMAIPISMESVPVSPLENVRLTQIHMDFTGDQNGVASEGPMSDLTASAGVSLPFMLPVSIKDLSMDFTLNEFAEMRVDKATWGDNCGCQPAFCVCGEASEGKQLDLVCPDNRTVISSVFFASFGYPAESGCRDSRITKIFRESPECHASDSSQVVGDLCVGSRNCTFNVDRGLFATLSLRNASVDNSTGCPVRLSTSGTKRLPFVLVVAFVCAEGVGHSTDVTAQVKAKCDGTRECNVEMTDDSLAPVAYDRGICQRELTIQYTCTNSALNFASRFFFILHTQPPCS